MSDQAMDFSKAIPVVLEQFRGIENAERWPVRERLTAFFFLLLDQIELVETGEKEASKAFRASASGPLSEFHAALRGHLAEVVQAEDVPGVNQFGARWAPVQFVIAEVLIRLLLTSLEDESEDRQRSAALADKALAFVASILTSEVPGSGLDVLRYSVEAGYLPVDRIPVIKEWLNGEGETEQ